jgi:hypothetical protein
MDSGPWNAPIVPVFTPWPAQRNTCPTLKRPHDCSFRPLVTGGEAMAGSPWSLETQVVDAPVAVPAPVYYQRPCAPGFLQGLW